MITPADIATAVVNRWNAAGLATTVTGGIRSGRLVATEPPYAQVEARAAGQTYYTEGGTGAPYVANFVATVRVYGIGEAAIGGHLRSTATALGQQDWTVPNGTFMHAYLAEGFPTLEPDPNTRQGEDIWVGTLAYDVMASGTL